MSAYLDLGGVGKKVTTSSADCQLWIDRGIAHTFGFCHEEAIRCFQKALALDSGCAMAHYFLAYSHAANYNNPGGFDYATGWKEAQAALEIAQQASLMDWEKALIEAQVHRFCWPVGSKCMNDLHRDYANAMRPVYQRFGPEDVDIAAFFVESLMMLAPWKLWTSTGPDGKPAIPETEEVVEVLEKALEIDPNHPGLCHFYIHTFELSPTPEKAMAAADALRTRVPDHGHLLHMPSHIDMWVGHYKEAIEANKKAVVADELYKSISGQDNEFYKMYRMHNYHFTVWVAMFDGQYATALEYAEAAEQQLGPDAVTFMLGDLPVGSMYLEAFACLPWHVLIRFGKWEDIVKRPLKDQDLYPGTVATAHYARGVAFAVMGKLDEADAERKKFYDALKHKAMENLYLHNNIVHDPKDRSGILDVAEAVLDGEVEYHKGNYELAFKHLRLAVKRDVNLHYDEPWGWMMPARHVLGALLLEKGEASAAEAVYREDLTVYKNNLWSLLGLHQALKQLQKLDEAESVYALFQAASARADVQVGASCLCATKLCCK